MIAIFKKEWREDPEAIHTFARQSDLIADLASEVSFDGFYCHTSNPLKQFLLIILGRLESTVIKHAAQGRVKIGIAVSHFSECVFSCATFLIALHCMVNVEIVKGISLNRVCVFMAFSIIAAQAKKLIGTGWVYRENNREVQRIEIALPQDKTILCAAFSRYIQFTFFVAAFVSKSDAFAIVARKRFSLLNHSRNLCIRISCGHLLSSSCLSG